MFAIRDRFGIKPLFYAVHEGDVFFASEVKALLALGVPARWNREAVLQEAFHFRPHSRTLFEGIYTVPPGHYAIAQHGEVSVYPYWDLEFPTAAELAADDRSDAEVVAGFRAVLDDAVRERLVADVEVASYLSGGIDSCAVLGLAQRHMDRPIRAFTLTFDDALYDESALARAQAERSGASFHPIPVTSRSLADAYSDAVWHAETCFVNRHGVAKFLLSRAVRDAGIKVVFTGEGSDEMLGGYAHFRRDVLLYNSARQDPATVSRLLAELRASNQAVPTLVANEDAPIPGARDRCATARLGAFLHQGILDVGREDDAAVQSGDGRERRRHESLRGRAQPPSHRGARRGARPLEPVPVSPFEDPPAQFHSHLPERSHGDGPLDRRARSLPRSPARRVAAGIPIHMKINGMREKHVLREATRDVLIETVYDREKHPFTTPPAKFGEDDAMLELFGDVFASSLLDDQPIFDAAAIRRVFEQLPQQPPEQRVGIDGLLNRVLSLTLLHQRFGMSG